MRITVFAFAAISALLAGPARGACVKPDVPACAMEKGSFSSEAEFDQCRHPMIAYKGDMESYASCLDEAGNPTGGSNARTELESALVRFNRRARREQD